MLSYLFNTTQLLILWCIFVAGEMDPDRVIVDRLSQMGFRAYSQAEILKLSVKEVTNPQLFDNLQLPTIGGLYDPALGRFIHRNLRLICRYCLIVDYLQDCGLSSKCKSLCSLSRYLCRLVV